MDTEEIFIFYAMLFLSYCYMQRNKRVRRFKTRPVNRNREEKGMFNNLIKTMFTKDHEMFFKYTRMTPDLFHHLVKLVEPKLTKDSTKNPLSPAHRLIITLHYLSEGCSMQEIAFGHYVGLTTVSVIIKETTEVLWNVLAPTFVKPPSKDDFKIISKEFFKRWNMPNTIGAIDGKHIVIQAPKHCGSQFFNYKKNHSIVLMASCDAYYKFTLVDVGAAGSNHDSIVFKESGFGKAIMNRRMPIPDPINLPGTTVTVPHFFVGDAAFPLHTNIMRPYPGEGLSIEKKIFNYRLSRARRTIENAFGILTERWRILKRPIIADIKTVEKIALATVALHNFLTRNEEDMPSSERRYCPTGYVDTEDRNGGIILGSWRNGTSQLNSVGRVGSNNSSNKVKESREVLCKYLNSCAGGLRWQKDRVTVGSAIIN